jgi:hypothetical protein
MTYLDIAKQYLDAWNAHDADAIVMSFALGGTYRDPTTGEISGDAIGANAKHLWDAFPLKLCAFQRPARVGLWPRGS